MGSTVMMMPRRHQHLRRQALGTDLHREGPIARGHEALRNERAGGEPEQHHPGDQVARGLIGQTDPHRLLDLICREESLRCYTPGG